MKEFNGRIIISGIVSLVSLSFAGPAYAACAMPDNPPGTPAPDAQAGDMVFNIDDSIMQYCNGTNWMAVGGGGGSSLPTCADNEILQYDDPGDEWECVAMPGAVPSGIAGSVQFSNGTAFASDNANFFWDDTNNRLGIGTNAPLYTLDVRGVTRMVMNSSYDVWIQGGPTGMSTGARNLAMLGLDEDSGDTLYINYGSEYSGGTRIDSNLVVTGTATATSFTGSGAGLTGVVLSESDPQVGTLTGTKWCQANAGGTAIDCTSNAPSGGAVSGDIQTFNASGTWTKPGSGTMAMVECWGGGGGGGRHSSGGRQGFGGGGGGYNMKWIPMSSLGATETVTIGGGGAGISSNGNGGAGGNTTFGAHLTAYGGGGGGGNIASMAIGGGGGGITSAGGTANFTPGQPTSGVASGSTGGQPNSSWHGGNGAAVLYSDGYTTSYNVGGYAIFGGGGGAATAGGVGGGGPSAYGGAGGGAGIAGTQPGGGGGGSNSTSGAGAAGRCKVTVF